MSLHITPEMMEATYELLKLTPPFKRWKLPDADDIVFGVFNTTTHSAEYYLRRGDDRHVIRINGNWCGSLPRLIVNMAHEMIHLRLRIACAGDYGQHGKEFKRLAAQVCRHHVIDPKGF